MRNNASGVSGFGRILILATVIAVAVLSFASCSVFSGVHEIGNEAELLECLESGFLTDRFAESYVLTADITVTRTGIKTPAMKKYDMRIGSGDSTEEEARQVGSFEGDIVLDGQGHTIKNLTLKGYNASIFGDVTGNVTVKNITFENLTINGKGATGALVSTLAEKAGATFENVKIINSSITSGEEYPVGGLIGLSEEGLLTVKGCTIENSTVSGINATNVGGLAGGVHNYAYGISTVNNSSNINTAVMGKESVGGLVGEYKDDWIDNLGIVGDAEDEDIVVFSRLSSSGKVHASGNLAGGIMGVLSHGNKLNVTFEECRTQAARYNGEDTSVSAVHGAGGVLGGSVYNQSGFVAATGSRVAFINCENGLDVFGTERVGGIVGVLDNKLWDAQLEGATNRGNIRGGSKTGGIVGSFEGEILGGKQFGFLACNNFGAVYGDSGSYVGGILGYNKELNPRFVRCTSDADDGEVISGGSYVGGISGIYGSFEDCENTMDVLGAGRESRCIGGIVGFVSQAELTRCNNRGKVSGGDSVGGLVGRVDAGINNTGEHKFIECISAGDVYALGQDATSVELYTNDDVNDIYGKVGVLVGAFITGGKNMRITSPLVTGDIYILGDTDYVGGWCGYLSGSSAYTLDLSIGNPELDYTVYYSEGSVSDTCLQNMKCGEGIFEEAPEGFNAPTGAITGFT